ncbi:uncharacterized protein TNCV_2656961 [Trichonephila clavipes]|nr:uncharacterized protein TNCV_2656961 [Trichonephila clavipes]
MPVEYFEKLVESMPRRVAAIVKDPFIWHHTKRQSRKVATPTLRLEVESSSGIEDTPPSPIKCSVVLRNLIHWCAKIKDGVEKLAYQLNEEAERTERPIRRLSKVMYGSTCADMQVDVMGERLSSIKHVVGQEMANNQSVRRHLDAFTRGRIIGKLEEGRSVTSVAAEFGIAHSTVIISPTKDRMFLAGHPSQGCFGLQSHCAPCYFFNKAYFYPFDFSFSKCCLHYTCPYVLGI